MRLTVLPASFPKSPCTGAVHTCASKGCPYPYFGASVWTIQVFGLFGLPGDLRFLVPKSNKGVGFGSQELQTLGTWILWHPHIVIRPRLIRPRLMRRSQPRMAVHELASPRTKGSEELKGLLRRGFKISGQRPGPLA